MLARTVYSRLSSTLVATPCVFRALSTAHVAVPSDDLAKKPLVIEASKKNIPQSPWKMRFLVMLARGKWLPDALAQLKFTPKRRAEDVAKILNRASSIANIYHGAIPEELFVKEIHVNKGASQKRIRIMGRGRTGFGYRRQTHVIAKLEVIDWEKKLAECETASQRAVWQKRRQVANALKLAADGPRDEETVSASL
jgi:large subunit ribosomal protein L22